MGLEEWHYSPPLPPFHEIKPDEEVARPFYHEGERAEAIVEGVEVYFRHPSEDGGKFQRARVIVAERGVAPRKEVVARNYRGGTSSMSLYHALVIPAEVVDQGYLGPESVLDMETPGECTRCLGPIPRMSATGRCVDRQACWERCRAREDADFRSRWAKLVDETVNESTFDTTMVPNDLIAWADRTIGAKEE